MKTTLTRLFTVMMLIMVSMVAVADVKVLYGKSGNDTFTGGKISATQEVQKDGQVAVTFTVKPDNGYTFTYTKTSLVIVSVYDPSSQSSTRADEIKVSETLWPKGTEGTISYPNYGEYAVTVDPNLGVWVQTLVFTESNRDTKGVGDSNPDYSGTYYIASCGQSENRGDEYTYDPDDPENNFYLCPTKGWIYYQSSPQYWNNNTPGQPFLTTFKCRSGETDPTTNQPYDEREAKWTLIKHPSQDYYYIRRNIDGKYLTLNQKLGNNAGTNRLRLHIEATTNPDNNHLFGVETQSTYLVISPKNATANNKKWYLNVHQGNFNSLEGQLAADKNEGPDGYKNIGGTIGIYSDIADRNARWLLEDIVLPVIEQQNDNTITITYTGTETVTLYYTTNGSKPDPTNVGGDNPTKIYTPGTTTISMTQPVTTVKAVAVKTKDTDETLDTYSRVVSLTTQRYIGSSNYYLFQNVECTDYYMIPGDVSSNNTTVNTSSLFRPSMSWYFLNAGSEKGVQYYYIINASTGDYLFRSDDNVYMKVSSAFDETNNGYKFSIEQGYDADSNPVAGFNIIPKGVTNTTYCIYKDGYADPVLANAKPDVVKGGNSSRDKNYGQWNIISAPDNKLPASLTYDSSDPSDANRPTFLSSSSSTKYFKIENIGTEGKYMNPPDDLSTGFVAANGTSAGGKELAWYVVEASYNDWQKYYYIIHAATGKYMYFTQTIPGDPKEMTGQSNVIALRDYDNSNAAPYQFVFAKSTVDGAYYIVPKGLEEASNSTYYALYLDASDESTLAEPIKSTKNRLSGSYKWKFVSASLFCNNPEFVEEEGVVKIKCNTNGAKIYINTESNDDPTSGSTLYDPTDPNNATTQNWVTTDQVFIKAIAIVNDGASPTPNIVSSSVVTLLNKPDITLTQDTYTYDGTAKQPDVSEFSIGEAPKITITATKNTDFETDYSNNINASTDAVKAKVTLRDKSSSIFIWHAEKEFIISPKEVGLTWNPDDSGQTTFTYSGLAQAPTVTATGVVGTDECTVTVTVSADQGSSLTNDKAINVGSYIATVSPLENTNYKLPDAKTRAFTITRAPVTVTADDKTMGLGDSEPEWTATVTGMMNNEDPSLIVYTVSREPGNENGTYEIIPSGDAEQGNYTVTYVNGTLTISAIKPLNKDDAGTPADGITIDVTYNGTDYQVVVTHRKAENDYVLVQGNDKDYTWTVASNTDQNHPEYDVVTVTGHGNYRGDAKAIYIKLNFYDTTPNDNSNSETAAAYYTTQNLQLSGGIEAWYVTSLENDVLTFEKVKVVEGENVISYIPANQPVLLFGNSSSTGFMLKPYTGTTMDIPATGEEGANILKVVTVDAGTAVSLGEVYVFSIGEFVLTMAGTLKKGKVYLDNPSYNSSSLSRGSLSASRGGTTGINDVRLSKTNNQFNEIWYALDGLKFNKKPTRKGIYLQKGKKVVIK